ncbi:uncharacterized protein LOC134234405 [Saccostrea cucullata]|uniref:uncharacterized protein LOC134234405 n=1 Tax=Saccostrea cuccullata TaxID=36930 RepID=UPI002ED69965
MENSEVQLENRKKQLEFLRNIWKAADSKSEAVKSEYDTTDKCNIDINSKKTNRRNRNVYTRSAESQLMFTDSEDEEFLENKKHFSYRKSFPVKTHDDDDDDEVIHNNFFVRDVTPKAERGQQEDFYGSSSHGPSLIVFMNSGGSNLEARRSSDDENLPEEEMGLDADSTTSEASKSGWKGTKTGIDEFSDGENDDYESDHHHQTHCHHQHHHCHHQHHHCHHNHQGHHIVCRTHGAHSPGKEGEKKQKYSFDYCDEEREPPKSWKTYGVSYVYPCVRGYAEGCGKCRNCKTGNMISTMEHLSESIDCEIHDVVPDGNCLFRSVVDQLRMNGEFHWTAKTIRLMAVEFLRANPQHEDGSPLAMFLSTESWDEYLSRMSRDKEWGDQLILRGISNILGRTLSIISAIGSGHNQTTIEPYIPSDDITKKEPLQLGHFDEQHYVSLRKKNWSDTWFEPPFDVPHTINFKQRRSVFNTPNFNFTIWFYNYGHLITKNKFFLRIPDGGRPECNLVMVIIKFININNGVLRQDYPVSETDDEANKMDTYFGVHTDLLTSIPFIHLHFLINKTIPIRAFVNDKPPWASDKTCEKYRSVTVGNIEEELDPNLSIFPKFGMSYNKRERSFCFTLLSISNECVILNDIHEKSEVDNHFCLDFENMPPSLTKLVVIQPSFYASAYIKFKDGTAYLSANFLLHYSSNKGKVKMIPGIECLKWPADILNSWLARERPACWPSKDIIAKVSEEKCVVVPCESSDELTWRLNFMLPIRVLIKEGTTSHQRHCYRVFKLLIDGIASTKKINLSSYAVKSIFLYAMEKIPLDFWTNNKGGCLLYLLDRLLFSIHKMEIPDYFIPAWNLLEDVAEEEIQSLYSRILAIRQFPIISIVLVTEKRGLPGSSIAEPLIDHIESIKSGHYIEGSERDVFFQISIEDVKNKLYNYFIRDATDSFVELYEEFLSFNRDGPSLEEFACSYFQDLPNSMQWWFYFFLDHLHNSRALQFIMGMFGGTPIGDLLGPDRKKGKFDEVRVPDPLLQESKIYITLQETDVAFLTDLSMKLAVTREYDLCSHYTMELIRLLKEKVKATADSYQSKNDKALYQTNYQGQTLTLQYYMVMMSSFQRLFTALKELGNTDLFTEYIEDAENACALIGIPDNYYYLAEFYRGLGCAEKYREAMRIYNGDSSDDVSNV